jgi:putative FmdB family regulatory protein
MTFQYACRKCREIVERDFRIGQADAEVPCPTCEESCKRYYGDMSFILKGGGWPGRTQRLNREMTSRNEAAGHRMRKEHKPGMEIAAYDYGNGDVRDAKDVQKPSSS